MGNKYTDIFRRTTSPLVEHAAEYLQWLAGRNYSYSACKGRRYYLGFFLTWCRERGIDSAEQITRRTVEDYRLFLCNYHSKRCGGILSDNSRRLYIQSVRLLFRRLVKRGLILSNPAADIEIGKEPKRLPRNVISQEQAEAIINAPDITNPFGLRDRAILETLYSTGIRAQELVALQLDDIDRHRGTIFVREGKGKKDRIVPVGDRALAWIEKYILTARPKSPRERTLFLTQYEKPFSSSGSLGAAMYAYFASLPKGSGCHTFRHTMGTIMLENGADIRHIQEILGHTDLRTTEIYTRVSVGHLRKVQARTHPAEPTGPQLTLPEPSLPNLASPKKPRGRREILNEFWNRVPQSPDDFISLGNRYFAYIASDNYTSQTIDSHRTHLKHFVLWCHQRSITKPVQVTPALLELYQNALARETVKRTGQPLSPRFRQLRLGIVCVFFRRLAKSGHLLTNPSDIIEPLKIPKRLPRNTLSHEEVETVLAQPDISTTKGLRDRAILEVVYSTGLRRSEISRLLLSNVNFSAGTIFVRDGKGRKDRYVPIGERALQWLQAYLDKARPLQVIYPDQNALFITKEGTPIHRHTVSQIATHCFKAAGKQGSCHTLRHTMATLMLENGADIRHIQEMLGHTRISTTEVYTHVSIAKLKEVHERTHPARMYPTKTKDIIAEVREHT